VLVLLVLRANTGGGIQGSEMEGGVLMDQNEKLTFIWGGQKRR